MKNQKMLYYNSNQYKLVLDRGKENNFLLKMKINQEYWLIIESLEVMYHLSYILMVLV
jgi:hypothetical protein